MLTRLRSRSRGPGARRAGDGPERESDPAEPSAAAATATGRRAFGDASNRNSKKAKTGKGNDDAEDAAKKQPPTRGRQLRKSTNASSSTAAAASDRAAAASTGAKNDSQKSGKRGRKRAPKVTVEEDTSSSRRSTRRTSTGGAERSSSASTSTRAARSSSRVRNQATKRGRATDDAAGGAETENNAAKRAKTSKTKPAARAKKEAQVATRSSSRTRSRAAATAPAAAAGKSEKEEGDGNGEGPEPRNLSDDFLVPPEYRLERSDFDGANHTMGMAPQDVEEDEDVLKVAPYVADICQHMYAAEGRDMPEPYMDRQPDINAKMRAILVDWLVEVHMKFRLVPETLYLCVNLIDRYCSQVDVKRSRLQLVGVTALLIACKYEEIYPPEVRDCVYITDRAYNRQDVLDMEQDILDKLGFRITVPTAYPFLVRFLNMVDASEIVRFAANYYMERTLQEHDLLEYRPSLVCAVAVILALNNPSIREEEGETGDPPGIPKVLLEYTGFDEDDIMEVAEIISKKVGEEPVTASRRQLIAVKRKFDHAKYRHVSVDFDEPSHRNIPRDRKKK